MIFNKKDHILHKKGFISQKDCDFFINFFEKRKDLHVRGTTGGNTFEIPSKKQDTEIILDSSKDFSWLALNYLHYGVEEYKNFSFSVKKTNSLKKLVRNIKIDDLSIKLFSIF